MRPWKAIGRRTLIVASGELLRARATETGIDLEIVRSGSQVGAYLWRHAADEAEMRQRAREFCRERSITIPDEFLEPL